MKKSIEKNNKIKNKKVIIAFILIFIIALFIILTIFINKENTNSVNDNGNNKEEYVENINGVKNNISEELLKEKKFENLRIFNISFTNQNGITSFTADLENQGSEVFKEKDVEIIFKNKDGSEYTKIAGYIVSIPAGATNMISASIVEEKLNAYDFEIVNIK